MKLTTSKKLGLDLVLLILMILLYQKNIISMSFHEIGGLVLFGLFIIHLLFNRKWIKSITKRLFDKSIPIKTRISYILNVLLVICWCLVIISGIFISKVVFHFSVGGPWKLVHFSCAAFALILIGIHIGLHWNLISNSCKKPLKLLDKFKKPISIICIIFVLISGIYSMKNTNFIKWITMAFSVDTMSDSENHIRGAENNKPDNTNLNKEFNGQKEKGNENFSFMNVLKLLLNYGSIILMFSIFTYYIELVFINKNKTLLISKHSK